jgi:hypothetical protein
VSRSRKILVVLRAFVALTIALLGVVALHTTAQADPVPIALTVTPSASSVPSGS